MHSLSLGLLLAAVANASPLLAGRGDGDLPISRELVPRAQLLSLAEEVNNGALNISQWESKLLELGVALAPPAIDEEWLQFQPAENVTKEIALAKRQDCLNRALVTDRTENFVDWDVQMSPVVCAVGAMSINVMEGYSTSNSLTVSSGIDFTWVKDKLSSTLGVNFQRTWTTSTSVTVGGTVPDGNCGCMIWKPLTTRRYGSVMEGCIGALKKTGTFMADDRGTGSYGGVQWISGARSLCYKKGNNPPLSRCQGSGNFV